MAAKRRGVDATLASLLKVILGRIKPELYNHYSSGFLLGAIAMQAGILERVEARLNRRLDKACGKSFISDQAKCYKVPAVRQAKSESAGDSLTRVQAAWVGNPNAPLSPDMHRVRAYMNEESSRVKIRELLKVKQRKDSKQGKPLSLIHLDKKCGASGIPDDAKCTKKTSTSEAEENNATATPKQPKKINIPLGLLALGAVYAALVYGPLLVLNAKELMGGVSLKAKAPDFVADPKFNPEAVASGKLPKIGEGLFGEAYLDKDTGILYKKSRSTSEVIDRARQQPGDSGIPKNPIVAYLMANIPVQHTKQNEAAAQYVAGQLGIAPKLLGKKGTVMGIEYLEGYQTGAQDGLSTIMDSNYQRKKAEALAAFHVAGISHNDLHDNNVMFKKSADGKIEDVKIIDFGAAKFGDYNGIAVEAATSAFINTTDHQAFPQFRKTLFADLAKANTEKEKQRAIADFYIRSGVIKAPQKQDSRMDAPPNCERGERCGDTCIDPRDECNIRTGSPELDTAIEDLSEAVLGAIPGYGQVVAAQKLLVSGKAALKATKNPNTPLSKKVKMGAIILAGLTYLGYQKYRDYRRNAVNESATIAKTTAKGLPVKQINKDQITFTLDGTGKGDKQAIKTAMVNSRTFDQHEIIDFSASLEDPMELPSDMSDRDQKIAREVEAARNHFGALSTGRNNHAVDLAAQIIAHHEKYPQKRLNVVAHGSGAQVAMEAADIVKKANQNAAQRLRVVNLQAPDYGIYDGVPGTATVGSDRNPMSLLPMKNKTTFGVDDPGDGTGFFKNRRSLAFIAGHLQGGAQDVRTTYGQPQSSYYQRTSQPAPATNRPLSTNVPRQSFVTQENKPVSSSIPQQQLVTQEGKLVTNSLERQAGMTQFQEYEKKKSQLESNINSQLGVLNGLEQQLIQASSQRVPELEERRFKAVQVLNSHREKLQQHEQSYKGPKLKTDSLHHRRTDSTTVAIAALAGAAVGAGLHRLATGGHTSRKKPHCTKVRISNGEKSAAVRSELYQWVARELPATLKRSAA